MTLRYTQGRQKEGTARLTYSSNYSEYAPTIAITITITRKDKENTGFQIKFGMTLRLCSGQAERWHGTQHIL